MKKIYVFCPGNVTTGGIELLHQFVDEARINGADASIVYFPMEKNFQKPAAYEKYNCPQSKFFDEKSAITIIPESATKLARKIKLAKVYIWWMSVDNYFYYPQNNILLNPLVIRENKLYDSLRYLRSLFRRLPVNRMKNFGHLVQSQYASRFLAGYNIESEFMTDYLGDEHIKNKAETIRKQDIVVYNPKKGRRITEKIIHANPEIKFIPIVNMTSVDVARLMSCAKLYIDFGNHPGKDRPPREAVIARCCVITSKDGSAKYYEDIPIPDKYKLDISSSNFIDEFRLVANQCLNSYEDNLSDFENWRDKVIMEKINFKRQVKKFLQSNDAY